MFLDFDGTISTVDTGLHLLERLGDDRWRALEARYVAGEIGSRECMQGQFATLPRDRARVEATTREVPIDPGLPEVLDVLAAARCEVTILSDGFGFYAEEVGRAHGLEVRTNGIDWERFCVVFPPRTDVCPCDACGTCKQAPIRAARSRGATTVLVGDGESDAKAAELADLVFAKGHLAAWCRARRRPHHEFADLTDLAAKLRGMLQGR